MATASSGAEVTGIMIAPGPGVSGGSAPGVSVGGQTGAGGSDGDSGATTAQSVANAAGDSGAAQGADIAAKVAALEAKIGEIQNLLQQAIRDWTSADQARKLEQELNAAGAVDIPTASALLGPAINAGAQIAEAVSGLKQSKPFLFRRAQAGGTMGPATKRDPLTQLAEQAVATGDKRALLDYLRARRGGN